MRRVMLLHQRYRTEAMRLGPVGYWRLGESTGTVARDETEANNGTYVGSPTLGAAGALAGDPNTASTLNGTSQYATLASAVLVGNVFSVCAWAKLDVLGTDRCIFNAGRSEGPSMMIDGTGHLVIDRSAIARVFTSTPTVAAGAWHFYGVTKNGATSALYIDGAAVAFTGADQTFSNATGVGHIGSDGGFQPFIGTLDEPAIWNRALTAQEIARLYSVGRGF